MPLPNLPTDNLYKFLALAGLTLGLFSFVFPNIQEHDVSRVLWETKIDIDVAGEQLRKPIKDDEMRILDLQHNLRIQQAQAKNKTMLLGELTNELAEVRFFSKIGIVLGLVLSCCGFSLWYVKLQISRRFLEKPKEGAIGCRVPIRGFYVGFLTLSHAIGGWTAKVFPGDFLYSTRV